MPGRTRGEARDMQRHSMSLMSMGEQARVANREAVDGAL